MIHDHTLFHMDLESDNRNIYGEVAPDGSNRLHLIFCTDGPKQYCQGYLSRDEVDDLITNLQEWLADGHK